MNSLSKSMEIQDRMSKKELQSSGSFYTDYDTILKVINPLFLEDLKNELIDIVFRDDKNEFLEFHKKISNLTFFDPACGAGNFLIVIYYELKKLESIILKKLESSPYKIKTSQLYGIEINKDATNRAIEILTINDIKPNIINHNSLRYNWSDLIKPDDCDYIIGNPPYIGYYKLDKIQREDIFNTIFIPYHLDYVQIDFVACWFVKAIEYIKLKTKISLLSTQNIMSGEQLPFIYDIFLKHNINIIFAYRNFIWESNTKIKASINVIILGLSKIDQKVKRIYYPDGSFKACKFISPYLIPLDYRNDTTVKRTTKVIGFPNRTKRTTYLTSLRGYIITDKEYNEIINKEPNLKQYIYNYCNAKDVYYNINNRYFIHYDIIPDEIKKNSFYCGYYTKINNKLELILKKSKKSGNIKPNGKDVMYISPTSSGVRKYLPVIINDRIRLVEGMHIVPYNEITFAILSNRMYNIWLDIVASKLGNGHTAAYRHTIKLIYNTFPIPDGDLSILKNNTKEIIELRIKHKDICIAYLTHPNYMPNDVLKAYQRLDKTIESLYSKNPFKNDDDRFIFLLNKYNEKIKSNKTTLFDFI